MSETFLSAATLNRASWQGLERSVARYMLAAGWDSVRVVGQTGDGGADVVGTINGRRWLVQVKNYRTAVGASVVEETEAAASRYRADVAVVVSAGGFTEGAREARESRFRDGKRIHLWDLPELGRRGNLLDVRAPFELRPERFVLKGYQESTVQRIISEWQGDAAGRALVVLATGLGKTFVAAAAVRRLLDLSPGGRVLVLAHTNDLVRQLERAFWPFLRSDEATLVANGEETFAWSEMGRYQFVFGSRDTFSNRVDKAGELPSFDYVVVDECHHLKTASFDKVLDALNVGRTDGPFLVGLTATDWRPDGSSLVSVLGDPVVRIDLVDAMKRDFLSDVDYRMFLDNIDWDVFTERHSTAGNLTPRSINKKVFIREWDEEVCASVRRGWEEILQLGMAPRGIVFCSTVEHAERMAAEINSMQFTTALAFHASLGSVIERNRRLWDFADGRVGILCAVDLLNEGVDVPDVNLVVFQRVTHSRRIFIQQLGRGLRLASGKKKVLVLDFVSDIRRIAEGFEIREGVEKSSHDLPEKVVAVGDAVTDGNSFRFISKGNDDINGAAFLEAWLGEMDGLAEAGDNEEVSRLRFPPTV